MKLIVLLLLLSGAVNAISVPDLVEKVAPSFVGRIANTSAGEHLVIAITVASGSSGGPVFDASGRLCGMLVGMAVSRGQNITIAGGIAYAVRVPAIRRSIARILGAIESPSDRQW